MPKWPQVYSSNLTIYDRQNRKSLFQALHTKHKDGMVPYISMFTLLALPAIHALWRHPTSCELTHMEATRKALKPCFHCRRRCPLWSLCRPLQEANTFSSLTAWYTPVTAVATETQIIGVGLPIARQNTMSIFLSRRVHITTPSHFTSSLIIIFTTIIIFQKICTIVVFYGYTLITI